MGDNRTLAEELTLGDGSRVEKVDGDGPRKETDEGNETTEASPALCFRFYSITLSIRDRSSRGRRAVLNSTTL